MDLDGIERLLEMFGRAPITELELSENGWRIRLSKAGPSPLPRTAEVVAPQTRTGPEPVVAQKAEPERQDPHIVAAGLVGTFYRRPAPDKPPFVTVGDLVADGQTLGIMEAMKMLVGVEADRAGRISEIFKEDGASVQAGDPLFALVPV